MLSNLVSSALSLPPLLYVAVALATVVYLKSRRSVPGNIPPFPVKPYPILGHVTMMKDDYKETFKQWRKTTGDIYSVYMGSDLMVVLCSYPLVKEAFVKHADAVSDRPPTYMTRYIPGMNLGIIPTSGALWKEQRSSSISILRSFGMGKNFLAEKINEEVSFYLQALSDLKGKASDVMVITNASVSNVICAILVGQRFEYDDPYFTTLIRLINENFTIIGNLGILNVFPWLRFIPGESFGARKIIENVKNIKKLFCDKFIKEAKEDGSRDNFIMSYFKEMEKKQKAGQHTTLDDQNLLNVMSQLFVGGTETTSTTLLWALLYAVHYPEVQHKVYKEVVDVIGTERTPSMQDKPHMNYTNAFIMEAQRIGAIAPNSLPHLCNETIEVAGYTIPKGATVFAFIKEILYDEKIWGDPLVFRPERFLDKEKNIVVPDEFIPFSIGRRYCMGESLAKMSLFLFITGIFQRFEARAEDPNNLPTLETRFAATNAPQAYKVRLIERT